MIFCGFVGFAVCGQHSYAASGPPPRHPLVGSQWVNALGSLAQGPTEHTGTMTQNISTARGAASAMDPDYKVELARRVRSPWVTAGVAQAVIAAVVAAALVEFPLQTVVAQIADWRYHCALLALSLSELVLLLFFFNYRHRATYYDNATSPFIENDRDLEVIGEIVPSLYRDLTDIRSLDRSVDLTVAILNPRIKGYNDHPEYKKDHPAAWSISENNIRKARLFHRVKQVCTAIILAIVSYLIFRIGMIFAYQTYGNDSQNYYGAGAKTVFVWSLLDCFIVALEYRLWGLPWPNYSNRQKVFAYEIPPIIIGVPIVIAGIAWLEFDKFVFFLVQVVVIPISVLFTSAFFSDSDPPAAPPARKTDASDQVEYLD